MDINNGKFAHGITKIHVVFLCIALFLFIITYLIIIEPIVEPYDERFVNSNVGQCAKFCKTTANCNGFAFDAKENICYPYKEIISVAISHNSLFKDLHTNDHAICNKIFAINQPTVNVPFTDRRNNSFFVCYEGQNKQQQLYYHYHNKFIKIDEGQNPDFISYADNYGVKNYIWPNNKYNINQLDLLNEYRGRQTLSPKYITNMNNIYNKHI